MVKGFTPTPGEIEPIVTSYHNNLKERIQDLRIKLPAETQIELPAPRKPLWKRPMLPIWSPVTELPQNEVEKS